MMLFVFDAWTNPSLFQTGWFVEFLSGARDRYRSTPLRFPAGVISRKSWARRRPRGCGFFDRNG